MKVTVFGATGGVGRQVVGQLLEAGHQVAAVIRDSSRLDASHERLRVFAVRGLNDPDPLLPALKDADAVISTVGPRSLRDGPVTSVSTSAILRAMANLRVGRIIAISAAPVGPAAAGDGLLMRSVMRPTIKALFGDHYLDLARMEGQIELSGTDWTVIRPPRLLNGPLTGKYRVRIGGNVPNGYAISRANTAHAMCAALSNPSTVGQAVGVAN